MCLVDCPMRLAGSTRFVALLTCFSINHLNSFTPYMNLELHTSTNSECGVDLHPNLFMVNNAISSTQTGKLLLYTFL